jgi:glycosyltransferase involved in cell wall biosynthesis
VFILRRIPPLSLHLPHSAPRGGETPPAGSRLLYLGSINKQDGVDLLVRSLHILVHELGEWDIRCDILGDGDDLPRVRELTNRLCMDRHLHFAGFVHDQKVLLAKIHAADICLESAPLNELNTKSTFIKIMEYMSQAKPIVAFDLPETRYSTAGAALLVPPNDVRDYALAIRALIRDPARQAELGRLGRQRIMSKLNWGCSIQSLSDAYAYLLQPGSSPFQSRLLNCAAPAVLIDNRIAVRGSA